MSERILVVDDDRAMCELLEARLGKRGFQVAAMSDSCAAFDVLAASGDGGFDVVVTDLNMRGLNGIDLCERVAANWPGVPVIVITAFGSMERAIEAIRAGAYDFITKPLEIEELEHVLRRALEHRALREEVKRLRGSVAASERFEELVGESQVMRTLWDLVARAAETDTPVLVTGESGTGKELVARAIHKRSARSAGPLVTVNCAATPPPLLESELFGHAPGAFEDAARARNGLFVQASGGTLFLDEVAELPLELQPKLLHALQERRVRPLGASDEVSFDVRIVAATNRDLQTLVDESRFREDLFFRLHVVHVEIPSLRSRGKDILLLAQHFLDRFAAESGRRIDGLASPAAAKLLDYAWPGNVRELQNCMERAVALTRTDKIIVEDLPERVRQYRRTDMLIPGSDPSELPPMEEVERRYIVHVLEAAGGNKALTARILGFDRKTLYRKLAQLGDRSRE